jgi:DNA-binding NarL/FixJ family response regulator
MNDFPANAEHAALLTDDEWIVVRAAFHLSRRQADVLRCLFDGLTDKQIAHRLQVGPGTVRTHIARLHAKLGVTNRAAIFHRVLSAIRPNGTMY